MRFASISEGLFHKETCIYCKTVSGQSPLLIHTPVRIAAATVGIHIGLLFIRHELVNWAFNNLVFQIHHLTVCTCAFQSHHGGLIINNVKLDSTSAE